MKSYSFNSLSDLFLFLEEQPVNMLVSPLNIENLILFLKGVHFAQNIHQYAEIKINFKEIEKFEKYLNDEYINTKDPMEWWVVLKQLCPRKSDQMNLFFSEWHKHKKKGNVLNG